jgi:hypothetical protein
MDAKTADRERVERLTRHASVVSSFAKNEDAEALERIFGEIRRLGLERNIAELDAWGYTTVAPDKLAPPGFADKVLEKLLAVSESRSGVKPDVVEGASHSHLPFRGESISYLLAEDPIFEEVLLNPVQLALVSYLVGEHCVLSVMGANIKGPNREILPLHTDTHTTTPYPSYAQVANATWALTDYTVDSGCLTMVPGSHRLCRMPQPGEAEDRQIPVEVPAGSLIVWHGNTWHGALPRTRPGLRANIYQIVQRPYLVQFEEYRDFPAQALQRNGERFSRLLGHFLPIGVKKEGLVSNFKKYSESIKAWHGMYY